MGHVTIVIIYYSVQGEIQELALSGLPQVGYSAYRFRTEKMNCISVGSSYPHKVDLLATEK